MLEDLDRMLIGIYLQNPVYDLFQRAGLSCRCEPVYQCLIVCLYIIIRFHENEVVKV